MSSPEEQALIAAYDGDWDELYRLLDDFLPGERDDLHEAAHDLARALRCWPERARDHESESTP